MRIARRRGYVSCEWKIACLGTEMALTAYAKHLYNGLKLGKDEIECVMVWEKTGGGWDEALKEAESWLVY